MPESNRSLFSRARATLAVALVTGLFAGSLVVGGSAAYAADEVSTGTEAVVAPVEAEAPADEAPIDSADPAAPVVPEAAPVAEPAAGPAPDEINAPATAEASPVVTEAAPAVAGTPTLTVTPSTGLNPEGDTVTVRGTGYNPAQAIYVTLCTDVPLDQVDFNFINSGCTTGAKQISAAGSGRGVEFTADGSFETTLAVTPKTGSTAVYTIANHTAMADRSQDAKVTLEFAVPAKPVVTGIVSSVAEGESLTVAVAGTGFTAKGAYVALIERGTEDSLEADGGYAAFALPFPEITDGALNVSMVAEKAKLDRTKQYEVLVWKQHSQPTAENIFARSDVEVSDTNWDAIFGKIEGPKVSGNVTKVTDGTSLTIGVSGTGFTKTPAYAALIERGTEAALGQDGGYAAFAVPFPTITDGVLKTSMVAEKAKLDRTKQYEVLVWKQHTQPTGDNILARSVVSISGAQWDQVFGKAPAPKPPVAPVAPVVSSGPTQPGSLTWGVSSSFGAYVTGNTAKGSITTEGAGGGAGGYVFPQSSSSSWDRTSQTGTVQYSGIVRYSGHHGLLSMAVSNPMIRVTGPSTGQLYANGQLFANLNLGAATRSVAADGSVTWSNVPVAPAGAGASFFSFGSYSMAMDGLSFTVGAVNTGIIGGTTVVSPAALKSNRQPAATVPATSGIRILTPADELVAGGAIEFEASGFEPGERGILVVLYSDPIVLDRNAGADANGVVRWIGTLPQDLTGKHTLTLQGSTNAGAEILIAKGLTKEAKEQLMKSDRESQDGAVAAVALSDSPLTGSSPLWWAAAAGLVLVAGALVGVVLARRRVTDAGDATTGSSA